MRLTQTARALESMKIGCALDTDSYSAIERGAKSNISRISFDREVCEELKRLAQQVLLIPVQDDGSVAQPFFSYLSSVDLVFNLACSSLSSESTFVRLLERLGVPFTGSPSHSIDIANNKSQSRNVLHTCDVRVPQSHLMKVGCFMTRPPFEPRFRKFLIKPDNYASSMGITKSNLVESVSAVNKAAERIWNRFGADALCDEFIVGREFRVGYIDTGSQFKVVGIREWHFNDTRYGFRSEAIRTNKRVSALNGVYATSPRKTGREATMLAEIGDRALKGMGIRGYATIDFRLEESGEAIVMEVNANPGLSKASHVFGRNRFSQTLMEIVAAGAE